MQSYLILIMCLLSITWTTMDAQNLNGEYRLSGIPETASAFRFTEDGKYEFFFIYGAVDRMSSGMYSMEGNVVKLKSDKEPGNDFPLKSQSKKGKGYTIQVSDANPYLLRNIICIYYIDSTEQVAYGNNEGLIEIEANDVDKIFLVHELFPDIPSLIKDENNPNNHFEVGLSPGLASVSFKGIDFTKDGDELTCLPNYVLPFQHIREDEYVLTGEIDYTNNNVGRKNELPPALSLRNFTTAEAGAIDVYLL